MTDKIFLGRRKKSHVYKQDERHTWNNHQRLPIRLKPQLYYSETSKAGE